VCVRLCVLCVHIMCQSLQSNFLYSHGTVPYFLSVECDIVLDREDGVKIGNDLMKLGDGEGIEHVCLDHAEFKDEYLFFQFKGITTTNNNDSSILVNTTGEGEYSQQPESAPSTTHTTMERVGDVPYRKISSGSGKGSKGSSSKGGGDHIVKMDKYGFLLDDDHNTTETMEDANLAKLHSVRGAVDILRWEEILDKVPTSSKSPFNTNKHTTSQSKVKYYTRRGLPDDIRQKAWTTLTGVDLIMAENYGEYDKLVEKAQLTYNKMHNHDIGDTDVTSVCSGTPSGGEEESEEDKLKAEKMKKMGNTLDTIERDIHRTFPKHYLFHTTRTDEDDKDEGYNGHSSQDDDLEEADNSDDEDEATTNEEGSTTTADDDEDDIIDIAEATGQDPSLVVEKKKELFNQSMSTLMNSAMQCGVNLHDVDDADGGDKKKKSAFGNSDGSLDIYDVEEVDEISRKSSQNSSSRGGLPGSEQALGLGEGQDALRRVLRAYSMYDTDVGYCQGMNFISAMFLTFLSEEEAFWLLVVVMNEEPYKLRELFGEDMAGTHEVLYIAEKLMAQFLPKLAKHMEVENIHVSMFVTQWLLTLYTSTFPFDLVARVWDCFLVEGWKVVYRVMLSLLETASKDILDMPFEEILAYFREFPSKVDGQAIMAGSLKIALKRKHIQRHVNEWRRHASGGEERTKRMKLRFKRKDSGDSSSAGSSTLTSLKDGAFPKLQAPNFLKHNKDAIKEIEIENLSEQLLPIIGSYKFAVLLHNVLSPEECSEMIDRAEENGFEDASIFDRKNNRIHRNCTRFVMEDLSLADTWFERVVYALKDTPFERRLMSAPWVSGNGKVQHAVGINERLRMLKYKQGQFFRPHNDAKFVRGKGDRAGETSYTSVHVYLNQKFKGGNTVFQGRGRHLDVKPRTGSVLLFEHNILHEGQTVSNGKKYIVRSDVMYSSSSAPPSFPVQATSSEVAGTTLTQQL